MKRLRMILTLKRKYGTNNIIAVVIVYIANADGSEKIDVARKNPLNSSDN